MTANVNFDKNFADLDGPGGSSGGDPPPLTAAGDEIQYQFSVEHQGGDDIHTLLLTDTLLGFTDLNLLAEVALGNLILTGDDNGNGIFEEGEIWTFTEAPDRDLFTYTLTQDDLDSNGLAEPDPDPFTNSAGDIDNAAFLTTLGAAGEELSESLETAAAEITLEPAIDIEKATNGEDADSPTGPLIGVGGTATFTYEVTNTGNVALGNVVVTDDNGTPGDTGDDFNPTFTGGDTDGDGLLDLGETWTYTADRTVTEGQYTNVSSVSGDDPAGATVGDSDPSNHFGFVAGIDIEKATNGEDADSPTGPLIGVGGTATFTYEVTNTGNVALGNVVVTDDNGTPGDTGDDFNPTFTGGDTDGDGLLDLGETWTYTADRTVTEGQYTNVSSVSGDDPAGATVGDSDPSNHFGVDPDIDIIKDGSWNDESGDGFAQPGETISYAYSVTTGTSNVPIFNVVVVDDAGTPGDTSDDFSPTFTGGDTNGDGVLDLTETWTYTADVVIDQADIDAGGIVNIACVTGEDETGVQVDDCDPHDEELPPPPPDDPGSAMTPGFWKNHIEIFEQESGLDNDDLYEDVFGVELDSTKHVRNPDSLTVEDALGARGGGQSALLRASTAAYANSASDDLNYTYGDADTLGFGVSESFGIDPILNPVAFADAFDFVVDMMELIDLNDDTIITTDEVVNAVQDVYDAGGASTDNFDFDDVGDVAKAFDAMNNMPHIDAGDFMV